MVSNTIHLVLPLKSRFRGVAARVTVVRGCGSTGAYHGALRSALQPALGQGKHFVFRSRDC